MASYTEPVGPLRVKMLSEFAVAPSRGSADAAGYDLSRYESLSATIIWLLPTVAASVVVSVRLSSGNSEKKKKRVVVNYYYFYY